MGTRETNIQNAIRLAAKPGNILYRNSVGSVPDPHSPAWITYGLAVGSGDLIGPWSIVIKPEHVGRVIAVFSSVEVKTLTGTASDEQVNWLRVIRAAGGFACIARSPEEYLAARADWFPLTPQEAAALREPAPAPVPST